MAGSSRVTSQQKFDCGSAWVGFTLPAQPVCTELNMTWGYGVGRTGGPPWLGVILKFGCVLPCLIGTSPQKHGISQVTKDLEPKYLPRVLTSCTLTMKFNLFWFHRALVSSSALLRSIVGSDISWIMGRGYFSG